MFRECFKQVKESRKISGSALSQVTGIPEARISQFINGKRDMMVSNVWLLLEGMEKLSPGAIESFCLLLAGKTSEIELNADQIADQIIALGTAWKRLQEKSNVEVHV